MNACRKFCLIVIATVSASSGCDQGTQLSDLEQTEKQVARSVTTNTECALETPAEELPIAGKTTLPLPEVTSASAVEPSGIQSAPEAKEKISDTSVDPAALLGTYKWVGNPRKGQYLTVEYKQNIMTFHADGRYTRFTSINPDYFDGQTQFLNGEGRWRINEAEVEVEYQSIRERDTTRIIYKYPGVEIMPGVTTRQVRQKAFIFKLNDNHIQRDDGSLYRRISSDPDRDPKKIIDHEAKRIEAMYDQIYSAEYGY
ncbi:hypothetical protein N9Y42_06710 [Mariniblastus sp.]|nr:hypothetical protein [Mariniblastus sp.]